jgi:hypothetical protein
MLLRLAVAAAVLLLGVASAAAQALPVDVSTRVGRAASFIYRYTPSQYDRLTDRDVYWSNQPARLQGGSDKLHFPKGTFSGAYVPVNRVPASPYTYGRTTVITACGRPEGGGCDLAWLRANHPDWIVYKTDQVTPAYMFGNKDFPPVDIANPQVQRWLIDNYYAPLMKLGYQALSVDNVAAGNYFGDAGTCSIAPSTNCTADGGTWRRLYSGAVADRAFAEDRLRWARIVTAWAHSLGKSTMANITYGDPVMTAELVNAYDVWYDEQGVVGGASPSPCDLNTWSAGPYWIKKLAFITGLNSGAGPKAYVSHNSVCPAFAFRQPGKNSNFEMVEYVVASYLLLKNAHSYLLMYFNTGSACGPATNCDDEPGASWPQYRLEHGRASGPYRETRGIYHRSFASALALVNPSLTTDYTFDLGPAVHHRADCSQWSGVITVPKKSGMVLMPGIAPGTGCARKE